VEGCELQECRTDPFGPVTQANPGNCTQFRVIANYLTAFNIPAYNSVEHRQPLRNISSRPSIVSSFVSNPIFIILRSR